MARSPSKHERNTKADTLFLARRAAFVAPAILFGGAAGLEALLGAATDTDRPPLFLLAGLFAFCAVYLLGLMFATRKIPPSRRRRAAHRAVLRGHRPGRRRLRVDCPAPDGRPSPASRSSAGQRFWELSTGSRIAYVRVPAEDPARRPSSSCTAAPACRT